MSRSVLTGAVATGAGGEGAETGVGVAVEATGNFELIATLGFIIFPSLLMLVKTGVDRFLV